MEIQVRCTYKTMKLCMTEYFADTYKCYYFKTLHLYDARRIVVNNRTYNRYRNKFSDELQHLRAYVACSVLKFTGELLIEELLQQGQCQMLDLIDKVKSRLDEAYNGSYHRFSVLKVVTQKNILKW